jgi:hypothetical protein
MHEIVTQREHFGMVGVEELVAKPKNHAVQIYYS